MSSAAERPSGNRPLTVLTYEIMESRPGYRVEIIRGRFS